MKIVILSRNTKIYSTRRLVEAGKEMGHEMLVIDYAKCHLIMEKGKPTISYQDEKISGVDVIIPRIGASITRYGTAVIKHFEIKGVPSLVSSTALIRSRDKLRSLQIISKSGIGIPKSVFARRPQKKDVESLISEVGSTPVILKLLEGTHGTGVIKVDSVSSAKSAIEAFSGIQKDLIVQEFIEEAGGKDYRVFVIDGEVVSAIERSSNGDEFRSNLHRGGTAKVCEIDKKVAKVATESAKLMGLTVAGVDIIVSKRGPLVIEINSSPSLKGIEHATGLDIASKIIEAAEKKARVATKQKERNRARKRRIKDKKKKQ